MNNDLTNSTIGQGLLALLSDAGVFLMIVGPIVCAIYAVFFVLRRGGADEQDGKMLNRRIWIAIACGIGCLLVGGFMSVIGGYFGVEIDPNFAIVVMRPIFMV